MRNIILSCIKLCNNNVITFQLILQLLVLRLARLAVATPRSLEKHEHVFAFHLFLEVLTNEDSHIVFFGCLRYLLTLSPIFQGTSRVCVQEGLDICSVQAQPIVCKPVLNLVLDEDSALDRLAAHVLLEEPLELVVIQPDERLLAGLVLDACLDGLDGLAVVGFEAEPEHVETSVHLELVVLGVQVADQRVRVFVDERFHVVGVLLDGRAALDYLEFAGGQFTRGGDVVESHVGLFGGGEFLEFFCDFPDLDEVWFVTCHLCDSGDGGYQRFVFLLHGFDDGVLGPASVVVGDTRTVLVVENLEGREARDALLGRQ